MYDDTGEIWSNCGLMAVSDLESQTAPEKAMLDLAPTCNGRTIATANGDRTVSLFQVDSKSSLVCKLLATC